MVSRFRGIPSYVQRRVRQLYHLRTFAFRCNRNRVFCGLCAENHTTDKHTCPVKECKAARGRLCPHTTLWRAACKVDGHPAKAFGCPARKEAKAAARGLCASQKSTEGQVQTVNTAS